MGAKTQRPVTQHSATEPAARTPQTLPASPFSAAAQSALSQDSDAETTHEEATTTTQEPTRGQQEAPLPELRDKHQGKNEYEDYEQLTAFVQGSGDEHEVDPMDVDQGSLGDCYFVASMAAVARANPDAIKELLVDNGDGTFDVTLYIRTHAWSKPTKVTKTIDSRLASKYAGTPLYAGLGDSAEGQSEGWAPLLEKRLAQEKGSYNEISGGNISKDFHYAGAFEMLTGKKQSTELVGRLGDDEILLLIQDALDNNKPVTCGTLSGEQSEDLTRAANAHNVHWNHAYAPISVDPGAKTINLQNPWGTSHVMDLSLADFKRFYKTIRLGGAI
jgi:hypothetical protein